MLLSRPAPVAFWSTDGPQGIEKPGQLRPTRCAQGKRRKRTEHPPTQLTRKEAGRQDAVDNNPDLQRERNVLDHLPERDRPSVKQRLRRAWALDEHARALDQLRLLASELERSYPGAAGSLREGMEETLTLTRLSVRGHLKRTLQSTNPCESMLEIVRRTQRNVKRWSSGEMALRWTAAGMLEAEKQFRRIIGYRDLATLVIAIERDADRRRAAHPTNKEATIVLTA